ncbi:MAG: beta-propeller domain-containing protein, partial [bacterium]
MTKKTISLLLAAAFLAALAAPPAVGAVSTAPRKTLTAFASEKELADLFRGWAEEYRRRQEEARARRDAQGSADAAQGPMSAAPAAAKSALGGMAEESVTNVQHAGVDEGGIVKVQGDYLVILRRGRLFTV